MGRRKLTEKQVKRIRELYKKGRYGQVALSEKYGVSQTAISFVVNGTTYKEVA